MKSLTVPKWKGDHIARNFVIGLPKTLGGYNFIWIVMDRVTKFVYFFPIQTTYNIDQCA